MDSLLLIKRCDSCLTGWHCVFLEVTVGVCALQGGSSIWANSLGSAGIPGGGLKFGMVWESLMLSSQLSSSSEWL